MVTEKKSNRTANGLGCLAGGLVFCLLFPLCVFFFVWLSFALGMSCALPSQCSAAAAFMKGILSLILFFGGGFAVPIFLSCAVGKAVRFGLSRRKNNRT
ncbi:MULTISPECIES: hypothetical protein [Microcystis]|uniref:hypothetical protein n=1 Tax=Microcystis TaxID=1125 RepID=UPI0007767E29|nr:MULTISPECIES: hypothetical protein [Microcystis]MCA2724057.1 hypothetical protein [Microcystis sp. M176S2]MCA2766781.1 hypothetical protein [Microcystis sp. M152S2]TRT62556.1 MAG: hypothetical protein EWV67_13395 [Microcystis sp. M_QC_C_20170808_M2Col]TRT63394.1 MAG: hypothetical protein EWV68_21960 [Microcystis sp. M_QC_C_20170808_M9Col]BCU10118.1 hypothetical protein MAN88_06820 [Microcystis aeruginosa]